MKSSQIKNRVSTMTPLVEMFFKSWVLVQVKFNITKFREVVS